MQTPPYRPLGNKYLVLPDTTEGESVTIGNVTLSAPPPDPHKRSFEGTVVAKGKSCVELEVGDKAVYGEFSGYEQIIEGVKYLVLQEGEILGEHLVTPFDVPMPAGMEECALCHEPSTGTWPTCDKHRPR